MKKILRYYYDINGKKIENEDTNNLDIQDEEIFHNVIAQSVIENNPVLLNEYKELRKHGVISTTIYLVMKGYIYVGGVENGDMSAMFSSISLNDKTRDIMNELKQSGYYVYDIIRDELKKEQQDQIRTWYKNGMTREQIQHKVMSDMIVQLSPKRQNDIVSDEVIPKQNEQKTTQSIKKEKEEDFER